MSATIECVAYRRAHDYKCIACNKDCSEDDVTDLRKCSKCESVVCEECRYDASIYVTCSICSLSACRDNNACSTKCVKCDVVICRACTTEKTALNSSNPSGCKTCKCCNSTICTKCRRDRGTLNASECEICIDKDIICSIGCTYGVHCACSAMTLCIRHKNECERCREMGIQGVVFCSRCKRPTRDYILDSEHVSAKCEYCGRNWRMNYLDHPSEHGVSCLGDGITDSDEDSISSGDEDLQ
jgi:hypothetical protein